jgi:protein TonB
MSAWSTLSREPLAQSLVLSAGIHLALLALVQPWQGTNGPQTLVINARLQPAAVAERLPPPEPQQPDAPAPAVAPPVAIEIPEPPQPREEALTVTKPAPVQMLVDPSMPPLETPETDIVARMPDAPEKATDRDMPAPPVVPPSPAAPPRPELSIPSPMDTTWYLARQVDSHPRAVGTISPRYPEIARQRGQEGTLKLMVRIDDLGQVRDVEVVEAQPPGVFDESALEAFRNARFRPATKDGRPVRYEAYMRVEFKLE